MDGDEKENGDIDGEKNYRDKTLVERDKRIDEFVAMLESDANEETAAVASEIDTDISLRNEKPQPIPKARRPNIHVGHRQRLRESALRDKDLASFSDIEIIELVLSFMIPRKDTNVLAHKLLDRFGSVLGVITAPPEELFEFPDMTRNAVEFLGMLPFIGQLKQRNVEIEITRGDMLINHISSIGVKKGETLAVFLDERFGLLSDRRIPSKNIPIREIVSAACTLHAKYVFVGRRLSVSDRPVDEKQIKDLESVLDAIDVELVDYIQVGVAGYGSRKLDLAADPSGRIWQYMPTHLLSPSPELLMKLWSAEDDDER